MSAFLATYLCVLIPFGLATILYASFVQAGGDLTPEKAALCALAAIAWPLTVAIAGFWVIGFLGWSCGYIARGFAGLWRQYMPAKVKVPRAVARERAS